ncbi:hypothetical protein Q7P37_001957 [Cladosporium fusiforme]
MALHLPGRAAGMTNHEHSQISSHQTFFGRRHQSTHPRRRRNDLRLALGFLELANALDFAANVWNQTPPPVISVVFMALGGTGALLLLILGMRDMPRSWCNWALLRSERKRLLSKLESSLAGQMQDTPNQLTVHDLQTHLDVNYREMGNEIIDRFLMGLGLGFGALTVAAGTYLAMAGANPNAFKASNYLTGYIGNVPTVIYGLMNAAWCVYGWRRAQAHLEAIATEKGLPCDPWGAQADIMGDLRNRESQVKSHALLNGFAGILGGAGGLMTATAYIHPDAVWGYLVLIPSIVTAVVANVVWRRKINYDRDVVEPLALDAHSLLNEAGFAKLAAQLILEFRDKSKQPWIRLYRNRNLKGEAANQHLRSFLLDYARLVEQMLAHRRVFLETAREEGLQQLNKEKANAAMLEERVLLGCREKDWNDTVSICTRSTDAAKPLQLAVIVNCIVKVLSDLNTIPDFLARLANNAKTSHLVQCIMESHDGAGHPGLDVVMQKAEDNPEARGDVLRIACETLLVEGLNATKSRARYSLELVGAFLRDR